MYTVHAIYIGSFKARLLLHNVVKIVAHKTLSHTSTLQSKIIFGINHNNHVLVLTAIAYGRLPLIITDLHVIEDIANPQIFYLYMIVKNNIFAKLLFTRCLRNIWKPTVWF